MSPSSSTWLEPAPSSPSGWPARTTFSKLESVADTEHLVQLYETSPFLIACVGHFLRGPLRRGRGAIVIATPEILSGIERMLDLEEVCVVAAGRRGQYVALDAEETLRAILSDGPPDPARLREIVGAQVAALAGRWSGVHVFSQMAGLLFSRGEQDAAFELQDQWAALALEHRFSLLGAYPVGGIRSQEAATALARACSGRARLLPPQRSSRWDWDPAPRARRARPTTGLPERLRERWRAPDLASSLRRSGVGTDSRPARRRILLVDDNTALLETLGTALELLGNEVRAATDGCRALEVGSDFHPDVIFMDLGMPNMNGYDAARRIRELPWGEDVTLVALTGWGQPEHRRRSGEAGFDEHLVKPVAVSQLQRLLEEPVSHD